MLVSFIQCDLQTYEGSVCATFGIMHGSPVDSSQFRILVEILGHLCVDPIPVKLVRCPNNVQALKAMADDIIELRLFIST